MIIGYDFWADNVYGDNDIIDNDGIAFDVCNPISSPIQNLTISNAMFDEFTVSKNVGIDFDVNKDKEWLDNTLMLAHFYGNLNAGTIGVDNYRIASIQFLRRKKGETEWQICKECAYQSEIKFYSLEDRYIESEQEYEYCIRPTARVYDDTGAYVETIIGENSPTTLVRVVFNYAHLFDAETSYDFLYNFKLGDITSNIDANTITTLGGQYPFTIYGASKYKAGSVTCLLVTEESATGSIDVGAEKILRNNIDKFLSNKKPKILKCDDGTYLLISISDNYVLTPNENLLGSYTLSFNYTEIGDANDVNTLKKYGLWSDV